MAELLIPAGNPEALDAALSEGADSIYMGLKSFNARMRSSNFAWNQFEATVDLVHKQGKKIFVTVNTLCEESETERLYRFLHYLNRVGPDGLIIQDFGVIRMIQEFFPNLKMHASTQMNIASAAAVNLLSKEGVRRVVLARELTFEEIRAIKQATNSEIEVFVHGALCVSESGLCLFSSYLGGKSANRGMCTQACRRMYEPEGENEKSGGGYFFSPYDLQLIDKIPDLVKIGVDSLKVEGRMKSAEYVGAVTAAYRYVLDNWEKDRKGAIATGKRILASDFARSKTHFWFDKQDFENIIDPQQSGGTGIFLGKIQKVRSFSDNHNEKKKYALLQGGSYEPESGDSIRLHKKDDTGRESYKVRSPLYLNDDIDSAGRLWIDIPHGFGVGDSVYLLQTKVMSKRYKKVLPRDLHAYTQMPRDEKLPVLDLCTVKKEEARYFPEGLYVQVSTLKDVYTVLSEHPTRIILELNAETKKSLLVDDETMPISKKQVFISLDPFCSPNVESQLKEELSALIDKGYTQWVVNNPAHINLLKNRNQKLIAGPYLYAHNRWAISWLENQDIDFFMMSPEISQNTIEAMLESKHRHRMLVTIFSYPALFRMRFQLPTSYDFNWFRDKEGISFRALSTPDGSFVMPERAFSIVDKVNTLRSHKFSRFLIDMSKTTVVKSDFKIIMRHVHKGEVLPETERFNWKEGFYSKEKVQQRKESATRYKQTKKRRKA